MAQLNWNLKSVTGLFKTKTTGVVEMFHERYLKPTRKSMKQAQRMTSLSGPKSPKFNNLQCKYLADKLKMAVESAQESALLKYIKAETLSTPPDMGMMLEIFKLLYALSQEVESFIKAYCKDAWIQAAVLLSNVEQHILSIVFNLELCMLFFSARYEFEVAYEDEAEIVRKQAASDMEALLTKLRALEQHKISSFSAEYQLAAFLIDRLGGPRPGVEDFWARPGLESIRRERDLGVYYLLGNITCDFRSFGVFRFDSLPVAVRTRPVLETGLFLESWDSATVSTTEHPSPPAPASYDESNLSEIVYGSLIRKENLGKGSAATVQKVLWMGAEFALKMFYGPNNPDFHQEVSILRGLSHPNIISLLCSKVDKHKCSIVMELMDGDLFSLIHSRLEDRDQHGPPFTMFEAIDIMLQVGEGMRYLHERRIVHRDLKSLNVLVKRVTASDLKIDYIIAKVADFGLSRTKETSMTFSNQTPNMGTTRWMAPETMKLGYADESLPETLDIDTKVKYPYKCDVYNFAMVCYEILTGEVPFSSLGNPGDVKRFVLVGGRPQLPDECSEELKWLIESCWSQDPIKRPCFNDICANLRRLKLILVRRSLNLAFYPRWSFIKVH